MHEFVIKLGIIYPIKFSVAASLGVFLMKTKQQFVNIGEITNETWAFQFFYFEFERILMNSVVSTSNRYK